MNICSRWVKYKIDEKLKNKSTKVIINLITIKRFLGTVLGDVPVECLLSPVSNVAMK